MKHLAGILIFLFILSGCTQPLDSDFKGEPEGLEDDELLWILRVHRKPEFFQHMELSDADSLKFREFNEPIFTQVIPRIMKDVLNDDITAYEDYVIREEEKKIPNISERLSRLGENKQDFSAFTWMFDVFAIGKTADGNFIDQPEYLRLVWHDKANQVPERTLANIRIQDLYKNDYKIEIGGDTIPVVRYIDERKYFYYPVYVRSNKIEYNVQNLQEAFYLKEKILNGQWAEIQWLGNKINLAEQSFTTVSESSVQKLSGVYEFPAFIQNQTGAVRLYLSAAKDHLIADWSPRYALDKIYPASDSIYYSLNGEKYLFRSDSLQSSLIFISGKDTISGHRSSAF